VRGINLKARAAALGAAAAGALLTLSTAAFAQQQMERENWQITMPDAASPITERIHSFSNGVLIVITLITLFVMVLLGWVMIRYNSKRNPVPSKTTHNSLIEVLWTVVPVIVLVGIAIPSFGLLFAQYDPGRIIADYNPEDALTVKVMGASWSWYYEYPELGIGQYNSAMVPDGTPRLLQANYPLVVPEGVVVRLNISSGPNDVIHSFALPSMGVKTDAVPGRVSESWFLAERQGTFYGQCSELCGVNHAFMPIELRVVSAEQFEQWVAAAQSPSGVYGAKALLDQWAAELANQQVAAR
jgi:cytochrome c oxidase subunit 2